MDSPLVERLGWSLIHFVWQGALVALMLAGCLGLARRAAPHFRYGLACAALALLVILPLATFAVLSPARASGSGDGVSGSISAEVLPFVVALWALGVLVLGGRFFGTLLHVELWRRRNARMAGAEWQLRADALAKRLKLMRPVLVLISDRTEVPSAWGVLRPIVLLPASLMTKMPLNEIEAILLHELAHIRRHDYLVNLVQTVVETALFYHPAVWWVSKVVRREREVCCDAAVVEALGEPLPYARALVRLASWQATTPGPMLSAKGGDLKSRIQRLSSMRTTTRPSPLAPGLAALTVLGVTLLGVRAQSRTPEAAPVIVPPMKQVAVPTLVATVPKVEVSVVSEPRPGPLAVHPETEKAVLAAPNVTARIEAAVYRHEASARVTAKATAALEFADPDPVALGTERIAIPPVPKAPVVQIPPAPPAAPNVRMVRDEDAEQDMREKAQEEEQDAQEQRQEQIENAKETAQQIQEQMQDFKEQMREFQDKLAEDAKIRDAKLRAEAVDRANAFVKRHEADMQRIADRANRKADDLNRAWRKVDAKAKESKTKDSDGRP